MGCKHVGVFYHKHSLIRFWYILLIGSFLFGCVPFHAILVSGSTNLFSPFCLALIRMQCPLFF